MATLNNNPLFYHPFPGFEYCDHFTPIADIAVLLNLVTGLIIKKKRLLVILEIGSYSGATAIALAPYAEQLTCLDTWAGSDDRKDHINTIYKQQPHLILDAFKRNTAHLQNITAIKEHSQIVQTPSLPAFDFIFIDADHRYDAVKNDYNRWAPFLLDHGIICGHDYDTFQGVTQFANEIQAENKFNVWWKMKDDDSTVQKNKSIPCDFTQCGKDAHLFVVWGADSQRQQANVCRDHCNAIWDACEPQIKAGICWWIQSPPKTLRERESEMGGNGTT
jgi:hypothetical protein